MLSLFIGDAFKSQGVEVLYSVVDNDDTLAAYAHRDNASVLSADNDFWRYRPLLDKIYRSFEYISNKKILLRDAFFK